MKNINEIEYDDIRCFQNRDAVCPYCGCENEIEEPGEQEESEITECYVCGKTFVYTTAIEINYTSEPYENYYLNKRKQLEWQVEYYKRKLGEVKVGETNEKWHREYYGHMVNVYKSDLEKLNREALKALVD